VNDEVEEASALHVNELELKELDEGAQKNEAQFFVGPRDFGSE